MSETVSVAVLVKLPDTPVIVTAYKPVAAVLPALSVNVLVLLVLEGLKEAVTPAGTPDADKATVPLNPGWPATVTPAAALAPWLRLRLAGDTESAKLGATFTVNVTTVVLVKPPEVPVIVTLKVPVCAVFEAVSVNVLLLVALLGLKNALTPLGKPVTARLTLPLNPFCPTTVTVLVPLPPCTTVNAAGPADNVKLPCEFTVTLNVVEFVRLPDVPVTVTLAVPTAAVLLAVNVKVVALCELLGLKAAVTPLGNPVAAKLTLPVNPFHGVTMTVVALLVPCVTLTLLAEVESVKVGLVPGQLLTRFVAFTDPMPVAKSHPLPAGYAGWNDEFEVDNTPAGLPSKKQFALPTQFTSMSPCVTS